MLHWLCVIKLIELELFLFTGKTVCWSHAGIEYVEEEESLAKQAFGLCSRTQKCYPWWRWSPFGKYAGFWGGLKSNFFYDGCKKIIVPADKEHCYTGRNSVIDWSPCCELAEHFCASLTVCFWEFALKQIFGALKLFVNPVCWLKCTMSIDICLYLLGFESTSVITQTIFFSVMTCTDYIPRSSNDYTSQMYSAK